MVGLYSQHQDLIRDGCDERWTWNKRDKSHEVKTCGEGMETAHFHPHWSNGTAGIRGNCVLNYGIHYWEIKVSQRIFGTSMMFGIGTKRARLHVDAFVNIIGEDQYSWGLSHKGLLWHNSKSRQYTKPFKENEATVVGVLFDGIAGTLTFFKDGFSLGVAFTGLNSVTENLYPIAASTAAKTEMTLGIRRRGYQSLQDRCRVKILSSIRKQQEIDHLPLPSSMRSFIKDAACV